MFCRRPRGQTGPGGAEQILLDANALAREAHGDPADGYFDLGALDISPDHRILAYAADTVGRRIYGFRFRDTGTGRLLDDRIPAAAPNLVWSRSGGTVLYASLDPETLRWFRVMRHRLGAPVEEDEVVYEETDETFSVMVSESRSRELLLIHCVQTDRAEAWAVPSDDPGAAPRRIVPRGEKHEFDLDHFRGRFFLRTNRDAPDFRLVEAPESDPGNPAGWTDIVPAREGVPLEGFELFESHPGALRAQERPSGAPADGMEQRRDPAGPPPRPGASARRGGQPRGRGAAGPGGGEHPEHSADDPRGFAADGTPAGAEAGRGPRLRSGPLPRPPPLGAGSGRRPDPDLAGPPPGPAAGTPLPRSSSTDTAPTASRWTRPFRRPG